MTAYKKSFKWNAKMQTTELTSLWKINSSMLRPLKVGLDLFLERQSCPLREVKKDTVVYF